MGFFFGATICMSSSAFGLPTQELFCANNYSQIKISLLDWGVTCGIGAAGF